MKILHIIWGFAGGGVDKVVEAYARMTQHVAVDARFVCLYGEGWGTDVTTLERIGAHRIVFRNRRDFSWIRRLAAHIDAVSPDILFAHGFNAPVTATIALRYTQHKPPMACSYHGSYHAPNISRKALEPVFNGALHWLYRQQAKGIVAVAEFSRQYLLQRGVPSEKVVTIHNGLPEHYVSSKPLVRDQVGITEDAFVIGVASRLAPEKGIQHLIVAMPEITAAIPNAQLVILGRGPEESALRAQAARLDLPLPVIFAGFQENADAWLDLYNVFALPSLHEYHSIALLEAMRAGRTIVATAVGGNCESVRHGQEGLIVPPADSSALARAVIELANNPDKAGQLAQAGQKRFLREFTEPVMLMRTHDWLSSLLKS